MKKILLAAAVSLTAATVFLGAPYYLGGQAQKSLETQHRILVDTFFFDVVSHEYDRGWFSSTETTVIRFHPAVLANIADQLPDNLKTVLDKPVTMTNHVRHGLFADGIRPVRAVVETEFDYDPEVKKALARFFGEQVPVSARNVLFLSGGGKLSVKVSPFDYEELSGIKLGWKGLEAAVDYREGFTEYDSRFTLPGFSATLADKGSITLENIEVKSRTRTGKSGISLGSSETALGRFKVEWKEKLDYKLRLNELVNMVTNLQIGAFINPNGEIPPNSVSLENLSYRTQTDETGSYIGSRGVFGFAKLNYGERQYGPLIIDILAEHLNAKSLMDLKTRLQRISAEKHDDGEARKLVLATMRKEGAGLLTDNPVLQIRQFDFNAPSGHVKVNGRFELKGLKTDDLENFQAMIRKTHAVLNMDISQNLLEEFFITQASGLFAMEDPNSEQEKQEIRDTIRMMISQTVENMNKDGYLQQTDGTVKTQLKIADNTITLNGKAFTAPQDDDLFAGLEDDENRRNASAPAPQPASAAASAASDARGHREASSAARAEHPASHAAASAAP